MNESRGGEALINHQCQGITISPRCRIIIYWRSWQASGEPHEAALMAHPNTTAMTESCRMRLRTSEGADSKAPLLGETLRIQGAKFGLTSCYPRVIRRQALTWFMKGKRSLIMVSHPTPVVIRGFLFQHDPSHQGSRPISMLSSQPSFSVFHPSNICAICAAMASWIAGVGWSASCQRYFSR